MRCLIVPLLLVTSVAAANAAARGAQPPAGQAAPHLAPGAQAPAGMTEIEGSKTPELIPDHAIWRMVFLRLTEIRRRGEEADLAAVIPLDKADLAALYVEAMKQPARDEDCRKRYTARQQALIEASTPPSAIAQALDELTIECRSHDLDAADRVMDGLSGEGRRILSQYIESRRHSMSLLVPDRELKTYRLPR